VAVTLAGLTAVGVLVSIGAGSGLAVGGGAIDISVLAPSLGAPLVVILVVPFVVGLGGVRLGVGLAVGLGDGEVLVSAPGVPVGSGGLLVVGAISLGGGGLGVGAGVLDGDLGVGVGTISVTVAVANGLDVDGAADGDESSGESEPP